MTNEFIPAKRANGTQWRADRAYFAMCATALLMDENVGGYVFTCALTGASFTIGIDGEVDKTRGGDTYTAGEVIYLSRAANQGRNSLPTPTNYADDVQATYDAASALYAATTGATRKAWFDARPTVSVTALSQHWKGTKAVISDGIVTLLEDSDEYGIAAGSMFVE